MNRLRIWLLIFTLTFISIVNAQNNLKRLEIKVPLPVCYASDKIEKSFIPPPSHINLKSGSENKCEIIVEYSNFPQAAKDAFEHAVNIWEQLIESDVPIYIQAKWSSLGENTLGSAGPTGYYTNFKNIPHKNRYYPVAIAEKITKTEITGPSSPDITASFNDDINWYFGTDGNTPTARYDFVTVVLHEITHGLGFTGFFYIDSNDLGTYGYYENGDVAAFDLLVVKNNRDQLVDPSIYPINSVELANAMTSPPLYANSPIAIVNNRGTKPRLFSPSEFDEGSSIYHLNDATYPSSNPNSLMTHAIGRGEAIHDPGPITKGIMGDIGWNHMYLNLQKPKDIEEIKPITFNVSIESNFQLDTTSLYVFYSYDSFVSHRDSLLLLPATPENYFTAELTPESEVNKIHYYIHVIDSMNRTFTAPTEAPTDLYSITIGPDNEPPTIDHTPIPFFLLADRELIISALADDNLGIDTVYVTYSLNGVPQPPFGLSFDSGTSYSGSFNFNIAQLKDGDEIAYNIIAVDSATVPNTKTIPTDDKFTFKVEKVFDPISEYSNDFNTPSTDFVLTDFSINIETAFESAALHSPHPYPSSDNNNITFDFSTIFKYPIILKENATLSFDEIVLVEPGESESVFGDDDFWDYVIVEGSKDFGETWLEISKGYDSGENDTWKEKYIENMVGNNSETVGIPDWFFSREVQLLENENFEEGDTILIRFRLFSDPYAHGWGWAIDNLQIKFTVTSSAVTLSPGNIMIFPNPFNDVINISVQANKNIDEIIFEVFNMFGQKILSIQNKNVTGEINHKIDLGNFADGMYFISVKENGKRVYSKKIIKN